MLKEFRKVRHETNYYRKFFTDDYFDLYVWYDKGTKKFTGFQLCYDKNNNFRALTWEKNKGFCHNKIDDGDVPGPNGKTSPILIPDSIFNKEKISLKFKNSSNMVESRLANFIYNKLLEYEQ